MIVRCLMMTCEQLYSRSVSKDPAAHRMLEIARPMLFRRCCLPILFADAVPADPLIGQEAKQQSDRLFSITISSHYDRS